MSLNNLQEYHLPQDAAAVVELLDKYQDGAMIVSGGTFLHGLIARGLVTEMEALIDISRLGVDYIKTESGRLKIGSTTTFLQLNGNEEVQKTPAYGAIKDALSYPPPQVMNSATLGGCVAASCPFFDLPTSLLALDGQVTAQGKRATREIPLTEFFAGLFENSLEPGEFVLEVSVPVPKEKSASAFIKLETNANDLAILNTAAMVSLDKKGKCSKARIYVGGGVGEAPVRAPAAEQVLQGQRLTHAECAEAGEAARSDVDPLTDHRASADYRKAMAGVLVDRTLQQIINRLG